MGANLIKCHCIVVNKKQCLIVARHIHAFQGVFRTFQGMNTKYWIRGISEQQLQAVLELQTHFFRKFLILSFE